MSDTLEREPKRETLTKPPTRWRNWWQAKIAFIEICHCCGHRRRFDAGDIFRSHCKTWPSKDLAESAAERLSATHKQFPDYLGAHPEGERP